MSEHDQKSQPEEDSDRLWEVLASALSYTVNEPLLLSQLEEFLSPKPAQIVNSDAEKEELDKRVDELQRKLGGVPQVIISRVEDPPPTYDCYAEAALNEMLSFFHRCRRSVIRTHMHLIGLGLSNRYEDFLNLPDDDDIKKSLESTVEERFWEHAETSYIRLASYWDRVGQLLDFVFFNIRQYERDGFASVMQRIRSNFALMDDSLSNSQDWKLLWEYQKSERPDGFAWLLRRRNLLVHSLYLRRPEQEPEDDPLFYSEYNHLDESVQKKLVPGSPQEELNALHTHLDKSATLLRPVIGVCEHGARLNMREERDFL